MQRFLRVILIGWLACLVVGGQVFAQGAASVPTIALNPSAAGVSLDGNSRFWVDATGLRSADRVEADFASLPWALREPGRTYNIDGKALWFQFDAQSAGGRWFLELASSGIDRAQLFYRGEDGKWVEQEAGDTMPVSQWPLPGRFPTFELSGVTGKPVRYWLRVEHARVDFASPIAIYDQPRLLASREREQFLLGAYFGLAALITLIAAANGIVQRDRNFRAYAVYVGSLAIGQLAYLGVGAQHVWDHWLHWNEVATFVLPGISGACALWFARTVTEPARFSRALDLAVWALIFALLSAVALDTLLTSRTSFALVMALTLVALAVVAGLVMLVWAQGEDPYIRLIALGFVPVLVMALFPVARGLNLIPASALTRYGLSIGAAIEMPILFYALSLRATRRRVTFDRAAGLSHNDALTGLAHNRTLLQRLESALTRARSMRHGCGLIALRISNFDALVTEYGREMGDRVLVVAASLLRQAITDVDLAARTGDHEFAILLEGPTGSAVALSRAQQIVASGLRQADALPTGTTLKFCITLAMLPERELNAAASLKWLQDAARAMPADSRKVIRPLNF
ncbi:sensor domain-containing diguanylate cyclase [Caenimonas aquaedulcis]|uniref:Diguanylate cyclase n=1 Tax=Caenimonas aquaedulcis TaxID=2793270 RepID=A0A931MI25_9BURK|nr:diguanylate cyclase [Caenimonas aquaedulcis]